jgi:hypothetical protein
MSIAFFIYSSGDDPSNFGGLDHIKTMITNAKDFLYNLFNKNSINSSNISNGSSEIQLTSEEQQKYFASPPSPESPASTSSGSTVKASGSAPSNLNTLNIDYSQANTEN